MLPRYHVLMLQPLLLSLAAISAPALKAELRLVPAEGEVRAELTLINISATTLVLVEPGDGSESRMRTPLLTWSIEPLDDMARASAKLPESWGRFCGNINALRASEVFELAPGARRALGAWVGAPHPRGPGRWRVALRYQNQPTFEWSGVPLGEHDAATMKRVRASSPVDVTSNALEIELSNDGFALQPMAASIDGGAALADAATAFYRSASSTRDARREQAWRATVRLNTKGSPDRADAIEVRGWQLANFLGEDGRDLVFEAEQAPRDEADWLRQLRRLDERMRRQHGALVELGYRQGPVPHQHPQRTPVLVR